MAQWIGLIVEVHIDTVWYIQHRKRNTAAICRGESTSAWMSEPTRDLTGVRFNHAVGSAVSDAVHGLSNGTEVGPYQCQHVAFNDCAG